jgi:hypothetical protein
MVFGFMKMLVKACALLFLSSCMLTGGCYYGCGDGYCDSGEFYDCPSDCGNNTVGGDNGYCGDGYCSGNDTLANCEIDCSRCGDGHCGRFDIDCPEDCPEDIVCGDGRCDDMYGETACPQDCAPENCGDDYCDWYGEFGEAESYTNCPGDCHCWNAVCEPELGEDEMSCWQDCTECGNGVCGPVEDFWTCPDDCERPVECGDMICEHFERVETCPHDCWCGNGTCDPAESLNGTCPEECGEDSLCGNGVCDESETERTCVYDCAECPDPELPVYCDDGMGCWPRGTNCDARALECDGEVWRCGEISSNANCCSGEFITCPWERPHYCPSVDQCYADPERCDDDSSCTFTGERCA